MGPKIHETADLNVGSKVSPFFEEKIHASPDKVFVKGQKNLYIPTPGGF